MHQTRGEPARFLSQHVGLLAPGRALDVAVGGGRNAIFLARHGWDVLGVDRSPEALAQAREWAAAEQLALRLEQRDLESDRDLGAESYDLIVVTNYLQRDLFASLQAALKPGGTLLYETFTVEHSRYRPMRDEFLLGPNELLRAFSDLHIIVYRELDLRDEQRAVASLLARKLQGHDGSAQTDNQ
jgi:SAM-dependent methyltransferase